jgi:TonB family protein
VALMGVIFRASLLLAQSCFGQDLCAPAQVSLQYPPLAKAARVYGTVSLDVVIQPDGSANATRSSGHPLLVESAQSSVAALRYPPPCAGKEVNLHFVYKLHEASDRPGTAIPETTQTGPSEYTIAGTPLLMSDPGFCIGLPPNLWRRLFHRPGKKIGHCSGP